jgi:Bacteriophage probable baseplate hub protein
VTEALFVSTSPVFKVEGQRKAELARDLLRLEIEETVEGLKTCVAHFIAVGSAGGGDAEKLLYLDGSVLDFGKALEVSLGPPDNERILFKGAISALEARFDEGAAPEVTAFAEDKLMKLRMTRRMKTYEQISDADIAEAIAGEHGLTPDVDADGPTHDVVQQLNQSDLAFLRDRGRLIQAELWCDGDTLGFKTRATRSGTSVKLVNGNHLLSIECRADLAHQRSKVVVSGYDVEQRAVIEEAAGPEVVQAEISRGKTGPDILQQAFGDRESYIVRRAPLADGEATSWAKAEMLRRARSFVIAVGVTRGTPDLVVGSHVELQGVGDPFNGEGYYATRVRHIYDLRSGHRTYFEAERPNVTSGAGA